MDHGEQRLLKMGERVAAAPGDPAVLRLVGGVAAAVLELRDVGARDEVVAGAAEDHHADRVVLLALRDVFRHRLPHLLAHGVALLGLVEDDPAERAVFLQ